MSVAQSKASAQNLKSAAQELGERQGKTLNEFIQEAVERRMQVTESPQFDAILFDVGGVLLTNGWDHNERKAVLEQFSLDRADFESRHAEPYDALERDTIDFYAYLDKAVFYQPRNFTPDDFIAAMKAVSLPIAATAIPVLKDLAATGKYLVGTLNNESRYLHEYRMQKYGIAPYLDLQLCSAYVGMRKPDADIYRRAIDIVGRPASRILFIDDRAGNAEAARSAGMVAIQFTGEEQLRARLKELEIL
jgi:putative hydrolase of the HAD superfamily